LWFGKGLAVKFHNKRRSGEEWEEEEVRGSGRGTRPALQGREKVEWRKRKTGEA
jgi:hypothetical protein